MARSASAHQRLERLQQLERLHQRGPRRRVEQLEREHVLHADRLELQDHARQVRALDLGRRGYRERGEGGFRVEAEALAGAIAARAARTLPRLRLADRHDLRGSEKLSVPVTVTTSAHYMTLVLLLAAC
jgi:hypothetical protein